MVFQLGLWLMASAYQLEILLIVLVGFDSLCLDGLVIASGLYVSFRLCVCL